MLLQAKFRGYFVPPRPEKNAVEGQRMSDAFVEERRASLQKYLQQLAAHPVIGPSEMSLTPSRASSAAATASVAKPQLYQRSKSLCLLLCFDGAANVHVSSLARPICANSSTNCFWGLQMDSAALQQCIITKHLQSVA